MPIIHSDGSTAGTVSPLGDLKLYGDYAWAVYPPGTAGLISLIATGTLLVYLITTARVKLVNLNNILVVNILLSDFIQSLGWSMNFQWARYNEVYTGSICTAQGFLIQLGDIAGAFWALSLAIFTFSIIVLGRPSTLSRTVIIGAHLFCWGVAICLATLGFAIARATKLGPFYAISGSWCWIQVAYDPYRFAFHYGPMLAIAAILIVMYSTIIYNLASRGVSIFGFDHRRASLAESNGSAASELDTSTWDSPAKTELQGSNIECLHSAREKEPSAESGSSQPSSDQSPSRRGSAEALHGKMSTALPDRSSFPSFKLRPPGPTRRASARSERSILSKAQSNRVDNAARKLFFYPIVYTVLVLPLAIYRITAAANEVLPFSGLVICGTIFGLSGAVNCLMYGLTRRLFSRSDTKSYASRNKAHRNTMSIPGNADDGVEAIDFMEFLREPNEPPPVAQRNSLPHAESAIPISTDRRASRVSFLLAQEK